MSCENGHRGGHNRVASFTWLLQQSALIASRGLVREKFMSWWRKTNLWSDLYWFYNATLILTSAERVLITGLGLTRTGSRLNNMWHNWHNSPAFSHQERGKDVKLVRNNTVESKLCTQRLHHGRSSCVLFPLGEDIPVMSSQCFYT